MNEIKEKDLAFLLEDMSYNSKYEFLDMAKNKDELTKIAEKYHLVVPANDLSVFKCVYAFTDKANLNGCILPKAEVKKSLATLRGKAIDLDHMRRKIVGYFLDAKLEGDKIIAYGIFFKGNLKEDYKTIKDMMDKGFLGVSFEAYGTRKPMDDGEYALLDIEWAGGALLPTTDPAFPEASVLEMSKVDQERVLEFASTLSKPTSFIIEKAKYTDYDWQNIMRLVSEAKRPEGEENCSWELMNVDFDNQTAAIRYSPTGTEAMLDMKGTCIVTKQGQPYDDKMMGQPIAMKDTASVDFDTLENRMDMNDDELESNYSIAIEGINQSKVLTTKERNALPDNMFAVIKKVKNKKTGNARKIRMFPMQDETHVMNALARIEQEAVQKNLTKLGISKGIVLRKVLKRAKELKMKELLKKYSQATVEEQNDLYSEALTDIATLKTKSEEIAKVLEEKIAELTQVTADKDAEIALLRAKIDEVSKEAETVKAEITRRDTEIKSAEIAKRKETLGSFAEGMTDEAILDDVKYENATLKKEKAELEEKLKAVPGAPVDAKVDLTKGSKDKDADDDVFKFQAKVRATAYGA